MTTVRYARVRAVVLSILHIGMGLGLAVIVAESSRAMSIFVFFAWFFIAVIELTRVDW